jgi:hypothetical protein
MDIDFIDKKPHLISWADLIEGDNCSGIPISQNNISSPQNSISKKEEYSLTEITNIKPDDFEVRNIMKFELQLLISLKKYIREVETKNSDSNNIDYFIDKFQWINKIEEFYMKKLNLPLIVHNSKNPKSVLPRSSYKFCEYNYNCDFNYGMNPKKKKGCYAQHFVHNYLYADSLTIIDYLNNLKIENTPINYDELLKCITTIIFVINHMKEELDNLYLNKPKSIINFHIEKSLSKKDLLTKTK